MKLSGMRNLKREPLPNGKVIYLPDSGSYRIVELLSETGGFSLTYLVQRTNGRDSSGPILVLKELFPLQMSGGYPRRMNGRIVCQNHFTSSPDENEAQWEELVHSLSQEVTLARKAGQIFLPGSSAYYQSTDHLLADGPFTDEHGNHYVLYSTYQGQSLSALIKSGWNSAKARKIQRNGYLNLILSILTDLAAKMHVLHTNGILHLDISPSNIFLAPSNSGRSIQPFLLDFGSAMDIRDDASKQTHQYTINQHWSAPELFPLAEYGDPDCGFDVSPATDTYSLCAILFWSATGYYPDQAYSSEDWDLSLQRFFPEAVYGSLSSQLIAFFTKGLSPWPDRRFLSADSLYEAFKSLQLELQHHKGLLGQLEPETKAALSMLYEYPPHKYYQDSDYIKLLFWGISPSMDKILRTAFHSQQVLGKTLEITVIGKDADTYRDTLLRTCPDLLRFTDLCSDTPAELYGRFHFCSQPYSAEEVAKSYPDDRYIIISLGSSQESKEAATLLFSAYRSIGKEPAVIQYLCDSVEQDSLLRLETVRNDSIIRPCFAGSNPISDLRLENGAFTVHWSYCGKPEGDARAKEMAVFCSGSSYNQDSSAAAALHVSAKLASLGLPESTTPEEWTNALASESARTALLILEHRRWNCYMLVNGYRAPISEEEIQSYAFLGGSKKFHSEERKIHPCLVPSSMPLTQGLFDPARDSRDLDALDQLSLQLHRLASKIKKRQEPSARAYLNVIRTLSDDSPVQQLCNQLEDALTALFSGSIADLDFSYYKEAFHKQNIPCDLPLEGIWQTTRAAVEFTAQKDYKAFDLQIINIVEELLK